MNRLSLGEILKEHRARNGVMIKRICAKMDTDAHTLYRIEKGTHNYNFELLLSYIDAIESVLILSRKEQDIYIYSSDKVVALIKTIRAEQNMTQREMSNKTGISHITIANIERGKNRVTIDVFLSIINSFGYELKIIDKTTPNSVK